jgi:hypothetical protein
LALEPSKGALHGGSLPVESLNLALTSVLSRWERRNATGEEPGSYRQPAACISNAKKASN